MIKRGTRIGVLAAGILAVFCAVALAATLTIKFTLPKHLTTRTPFTVSGETYGYTGAEFFNIFYDTSRCKGTEPAESSHAFSAGVYKAANLITPADVQGPYSFPLKLGKSARHANWLCAYIYDSLGSGRFRTQRVKTVHIHL